MQQKPSIFSDNRILKGLSSVDLALLKPDFEPVELPVRQVLEIPNKPIKHSYFIEYGLASIVAAIKHKRLEVGLIGCEGVTGLPIILGNDRSPNETFMQVPGHGLRIAADKLRKAIAQSRSLERALLNFAYSFMNQTANTALWNGTATLEARLARWLLMANDRLRGDEVPLTHEFLSLMLGVRRAGVTVALHYLEQRALIRMSRKQIVITDRKGLRAAANGSYHEAEKPGKS
jgi:CRP-like cAMP-binding protein